MTLDCVNHPSPEGTAERYPGRSPGICPTAETYISQVQFREYFIRNRVPSADCARHYVPRYLQPSLRDWIMLRAISPGLASWAIFSRPFGTVTFRLRLPRPASWGS